MGVSPRECGVVVEGRDGMDDGMVDVWLLGWMCGVVLHVT